MAECMRNFTKLLGLIAVATGLFLPGAQAAPIVPVSYDMQNGYIGFDGYYDDSYDGNGCKTCPLAFLSGGKGDLTDGIIATQSWNIVEILPGPGPYIGFAVVNPLIHFNLGSSVLINSVTLYLDDTNGLNGVAPPSSVTINATNYLIPDPVAGDPFAFSVTGLNLNVSTLDIELFYGGGVWIFLSEVQFNAEPGNIPTVSEPATLVLLGAGLMGLAAVRRKP